MSADRPIFYLPEPVGVNRPTLPHEWPYNKPYPTGYTKVVIVEDEYWLIVRNDVIADSPAWVAAARAFWRPQVLRAVSRLRRQQLGMRVVDGGAA